MFSLWYFIFYLKFRNKLKGTSTFFFCMWQIPTENNQMTKLIIKWWGTTSGHIFFFSGHIFKIKSWRICRTRFLKKKKKKSPKAKVQAWKMSWMQCWEQRNHTKLTCHEMYKKKSHNKSIRFQISVWLNHFKWLVETLLTFGLLYFICAAHIFVQRETCPVFAWT